MLHPYATADYAESLSHIGLSLAVPEWGCHVLVRDLGGGYHDAVGCYPLAILAADADLEGGLDRLRREGLAAVVLVADDFHRPPLPKLEQAFSVLRPYKTHYLARPCLAEPLVSRDHRYKIRRAARRIMTGRLDLAANIDAWTSLYDELIRRHGLGATHRFRQEHVQTLARLPGIVAIGGWRDGTLVSAHIWAHDGRSAHSHLTASNAEGYAHGAAYAVNAAALEHFTGFDLINFGGTAGADDGRDGLAQFKSGFANDRAQSWLCGAILNEERYNALAMARPRHDGFFPAYQTNG